MKFFHLSDLHIGLSLVKHDLSEDQRYIFKQIYKAANTEKPDAIVIAGDIYNNAVPSAEAVSLFNEFIVNLRACSHDSVIMMISGNHDSSARIDCYRDILALQKLYMIGEPPEKENEHIQKVVLHDEYGLVNFWLLPFVKPTKINNIVGVDEHGNNYSYDESLHRLIRRESIDSCERNVLVSHQFYIPKGSQASEVERMDSEIYTVGNIDSIRSDILELFDYAALGHIHKPMKVGSDFYRYCGTPLAYSVSEAGQKKGIIVVEMKEKNNVSTRVIELDPIRQVKKIKGHLDYILSQACDDYVSVVLDDDGVPSKEKRERIVAAFPNLLNIEFSYSSVIKNENELIKDSELDPFTLCCEYINDRLSAFTENGLDEKDRDILKDVIACVMGGTEK